MKLVDAHNVCLSRRFRKITAFRTNQLISCAIFDRVRSAVGGLILTICVFLQSFDFFTMAMCLSKVVILLILVVVAEVLSFYLPGLYPVNFCEPGKETDTCRAVIPVFVNRLDSKDSVLTYEYHDFDFCLGPEELETPFENLGQVLFGERIRPSPYKIVFNVNQTCKVLCTKSYRATDASDLRRVQALIHGIKLGYTHHWIIDNLPVTFCAYSGNSMCMNGFPMGVPTTERGTKEIPDAFYLFNHIDFLIEYRDLSDDPSYFDNPVGGRIISVKATPSSIGHVSPEDANCKNPNLMALAEDFKTLNIVYTYSVSFVKTDVKWASRWDYILNLNVSSNIQWFGISNSILIILFLSTMIGIILLRTLRRDIARYNQFDNTDDVQEEFGWKLVHGDVFRPPKHCLLLSAFVGSGMQILCMTFVTLVFAFLGFVSPARRGSTMTCLVTLYVFFGIVNGYVSARLYKAVGGLKWKLNILLTCFLCPGVIFGLFFMCNVILWVKNSSTAVPFSTLCLLLFLWFGISLPLTFVGAYFGYRKPRPAYPVRTNQIPRQIPPQPTFAKPFPAMFMAGVLPFGCIYVQMFFIFNSLWAHQTYYMFGFLFSVFLILLITLAETSVVLSYFQLCGEDYRWWWRSFLSSGFTAFYLFIYSIYFFFAKLTMTGAVSFVLYFSYCIIFVFIFFLLCGAVGFVSCFCFVRKIYSVVKVD
uniref:Transmembrane 9 superfamily member n=1 Tax=Trichuris muris TaxID=70415 RepID=A0A5S6QYT3_TRIMR